MTDFVATISNVLRRKWGGRDYCFGTMTTDKIKDLTFVPVLETSKKTYLRENPDEGYQRPGSPSRMRAFMKFLADHPNSVVPPVLLSGRAQWKFLSDDADGTVGRLQIGGPAAIVDGQHRMGGYVALYEKEEEARDIPFILLEALSVEEEMQEFIVVNNSQKGVPRALTAYLEDTEEAQISWALNEDPDSPLYSRIARITPLQKQHLFALHSVARQMKGLFKRGALVDLDTDTKIEFAEKFFSIVADSLPDEWGDIERLDDEDSRGRRDFDYKLLELTGLIAWCTVGSLILHRSYSEDAGMNWENVERHVKAAGGVDWRKEGQYAGRTGSAGARVIVQDMERSLPPEALESVENE